MHPPVEHKTGGGARFESASRSKLGLYLYAVADSSLAGNPALKGIDGCEVRMVIDGAVAAAVSDCENRRIRPARANLAAHNEVLKRLMTVETVLPMAFGTVADSEASLRRMLKRNQKEFARELERVRGRVEMGLRVVWDVPNIFEYFVDTHDELRETRDRLLGRNAEPRQEDKIELGRLFDRILGEERDAQCSRLEEALEDYCHETRRSASRNLNEVANLSFLVDRDRQKDFEDAVFRAAGLFDNSYAFDINGPWAPHNFVNLSLRLNDL